MKNIIKVLIFGIIVTLSVFGIINDLKKFNNDDIPEYKFVENNGWLGVNEGKLVNENNELIQLRGLSTHHVYSFFNLYSYDNIKYFRDNWNINVIRIAMYTNPDQYGYVINKRVTKDVEKIVEYCKDLDIYVIIDWHILEDSNPLTYMDESIEFFDEMSKLYSDDENVIYEICNEPGVNISWKKHVKPYSNKIIKTIRNNSPKSVILVGTPNYGKDISSVYNNPLEFDNIMYTAHIYSGSMSSSFKDDINEFLDKKLGLFITEIGITNDSGDGKIYPNQFNDWISYFNDKDISFTFWSFSNKDESSSILNPNFMKNSLQDNTIDNYLTETGVAVRDAFINNHK